MERDEKHLLYIKLRIDLLENKHDETIVLTFTTVTFALLSLLLYFGYLPTSDASTALADEDPNINAKFVDGAYAKNSVDMFNNSIVPISVDIKGFILSRKLIFKMLTSSSDIPDGSAINFVVENRKVMVPHLN